ncbi:MAG: hypothetical protein WA621_12890 [Candidatus Acidiferrum sp.]
MNRRVSSVLLSCLLSAAVLHAQSVPAGVILQSSSARLNTTDASVGTTLYDGDRLETQDKGALSVRSGQVQLALLEDSLLWMNHDNSVLAPTLQRGTVTFRAETGEGIEIRADDVRVRPHSPVLTVGEVTLEKCDVLVTARTQSLDVTAGKETKILDEGKSYRVSRIGACAAVQYHAPLIPAQSRFFLIPAAIGVGVLIWVLNKGPESPDHP